MKTQTRRLVSLLLLVVVTCGLPAPAGAQDSEGAGSREKAAAALAEAAMDLLRSRLTPQTRFTDFTVAAMEDMTREQFERRLEDALFGVSLEIVNEAPARRAGYLFMRGSDQILCEIKNDRAVWCVAGLGLSKDPGRCSTAWMYQHMARPQSWKDVPGQILACEIRVVSGTGLGGNGVALFHLDESLEYLGFFPTDEYVVGHGFEGIVTFTGGIELLSSGGGSVSLSLCPRLEFESEGNGDARHKELPCERYAIRFAGNGIEPLDGPGAGQSLNSILMSVYEEEAKALVARTGDGNDTVRCRYVDAGGRVVFDTSCTLVRTRSERGCGRDPYLEAGEYRLEFSAGSKVTLVLGCGPDSARANGIPARLEHVSVNGRGYLQLRTAEGELFEFQAEPVGNDSGPAPWADVPGNWKSGTCERTGGFSAGPQACSIRETCTDPLEGETGCVTEFRLASGETVLLDVSEELHSLGDRTFLGGEILRLGNKVCYPRNASDDLFCVVVAD